jgi:heat shock protein HslJ
MRAKLAVLTVALLALTGCGVSTGYEADPDGDDITGSWQLTAGTDTTGTFDLDDVPQPVTLEIADGTASGNAPCNSFTGEVGSSTEGVEFGPLATTRMACSPDSVMELESRYIAGLEAVDTATVDGSTLTLTLNDDVLELIFDEVVPTPAAELVGPTWTLETVLAGNSAGSVAGDATLSFGEDGTFRGNAGCHGFSGYYVYKDDAVNFTSLDVDHTACTDELAAQETTVFDILGQGFMATIDGDTLTATKTGGDGALVYRAEEPQ